MQQKATQQQAQILQRRECASLLQEWSTFNRLRPCAQTARPHLTASSTEPRFSAHPPGDGDGVGGQAKRGRWHSPSPPVCQTGRMRPSAGQSGHLQKLGFKDRPERGIADNQPRIPAAWVWQCSQLELGEDEHRALPPAPPPKQLRTLGGETVGRSAGVSGTAGCSGRAAAMQLSRSCQDIQVTAGHALFGGGSGGSCKSF
ncbi:hypothetical protein AAFF_G00165310 [Aldrovandia affinis]|uniref:Uncharacterized protein n=1 Tax=Aldrovandia affinis TaxID=143900 RepID=A0AAD7RMK6_9TELE|nr:hypothetical protein AAFF_G00165310 [Aldrovandia affinis]